MKDRDRQIALYVLEGHKIEETARKFDLTPFRIRCIVKSVVGAVDVEFAAKYCSGPAKERRGGAHLFNELQIRAGELAEKLRTY